MWLLLNQSVGILSGAVMLVARLCCRKGTRCATVDDDERLPRKPMKGGGRDLAFSVEHVVTVDFPSLPLFESQMPT